MSTVHPTWKITARQMQQFNMSHATSERFVATYSNQSNAVIIQPMWDAPTLNNATTCGNSIWQLGTQNKQCNYKQATPMFMFTTPPFPATRHQRRKQQSFSTQNGSLPGKAFQSGFDTKQRHWHWQRTWHWSKDVCQRHAPDLVEFPNHFIIWNTKKLALTVDICWR